jgi:hypothetical protein
LVDSRTRPTLRVAAQGPLQWLEPIRDWLNAAEGREYLAVGIVDGVVKVKGGLGGIREFEELVDLAPDGSSPI